MIDYHLFTTNKIFLLLEGKSTLVKYLFNASSLFSVFVTFSLYRSFIEQTRNPFSSKGNLQNY